MSVKKPAEKRAAKRAERRISMEDALREIGASDEEIEAVLNPVCALCAGLGVAVDGKPCACNEAFLAP
jgi:hypothetical protein